MKPLLQELDAVLFDLDGTLVETNIDFALMKREVIALAVEAGMSVDDVRDLDILGIVDAAVNFVRSHRSGKEAGQLRRRAMALLEQIEMRHAHKTTEIPFARELVKTLREHGVPMGIVTRNCRAACELSLRITGINIQTLICREDANNHKPHPEPVLLALERLNARPGNSIMIGDHTMDIRSAKSAGTKTIGFLRPNRPVDFFADVDPDFVAKDLREVLDAIIDSDS